MLKCSLIAEVEIVCLVFQVWSENESGCDICRETRLGSDVFVLLFLCF